jgi:phosphotransferase system HPr-like phosphotransfer protein
MFEPSVKNIFVLKDYFNRFTDSVLVSRNDEMRRTNTKSLIGWLSLGLARYDTINLYFENDVNVQNIKRALDLIEIE